MKYRHFLRMRPALRQTNNTLHDDSMLITTFNLQLCSVMIKGQFYLNLTRAAALKDLLMFVLAEYFPNQMDDNMHFVIS